MKKRDPVSNYFEKRVCFQTEFEKIPHWGLGPGPWPGLLFQTQFGNGPCLQNSLEKDPCFQTFWKMVPRPVFKNATEPFCSMLHLLIGDGSYHVGLIFEFAIHAVNIACSKFRVTLPVPKIMTLCDLA